jgi:type I restriction-modification system DNA methylase subunit
LDWLELVSGAFFLKNQGRFPIEKRADRLLLSNLAEVRRQLVNSKPKLPSDIAHDLLARLIFVQFLFHRKDAAGKAALNADVLERLYKENKLSAKYRKLTEILRNESDTYALFRWLNKIFNGDLFPGKGSTEGDQLREWEEERQHVFAEPHLKILADFVSGTLDMGTGQQCLWPMYSFDAIPLDFISSIYEEFVSTQDDHNGSHYTPGHVVDFMLDKVLPWKSTKWDLKVLDPACGSGIFLVKVFQRLIYRWRRANRGDPNATDLRSLLSRNLFGVDINPHAVRVASFSLYLAMCDEIDPRHYWTKVKFPRLRGKSIIAKDFFSEDTRGFRTREDAGKYDLIVGNAPWGRGTLKPESEEWAKSHGWQSFNDQVGTLFLPKGASLLKRSGRLMMLQPAGDLLFNSNTTALRFRKKLFSTYKVEEVVNFSAIRVGLFPNAIGPTCSITLRPVQPEDDEPLAYWHPKQHSFSDGEYRVTLEAHDLNRVYPREAAIDPSIWTILAWGSRRDAALIRKLKEMVTRRQAMKKPTDWRIIRGFQRGTTNAEEFPVLKNLPILEDHEAWSKLEPTCDVSAFPRNTDPLFERPRVKKRGDTYDLSNYRMPAILLRESLRNASERFEARLVTPAPNSDDILLFSQSFYGFSCSDESDLAALFVALNSGVTVYYFFLSAGRVGNYRPTVRKGEVEDFPLPMNADLHLADISHLSPRELDEKAFEIYELKPAERVLVEDMLNFTLPDFLKGQASLGRQVASVSKGPGHESILREYCEQFIRVLRAGFGKSDSVFATYFETTSEEPPHYCIVAFHLTEVEGKNSVQPCRLDDRAMREKLHRLNLDSVRCSPRDGGIFYQRIAKLYEVVEFPSPDGRSKRVPTVYIVKPNQMRYWTRSMALRDADEVFADIICWQERAPSALSEQSHA